jgi:hypothetical protein
MFFKVDEPGGKADRASITDRSLWGGAQAHSLDQKGMNNLCPCISLQKGEHQQLCRLYSEMTFLHHTSQRIPMHPRKTGFEWTFNGQERAEIAGQVHDSLQEA